MHGPCRREQWFELGIVLVISNSGKQAMRDGENGNEFLLKLDVFNFFPPKYYSHLLKQLLGPHGESFIYQLIFS